LLGLVQSVLLLAADFNGGGHVENGLFAIFGLTCLFDKLSYFLRALGLNIAIEQESRVILVVVC
jgi:hypothetical protein